MLGNVHGRLNASWKICSLAVNGQSFLVIDGYLLNSQTNSKVKVRPPPSLHLIIHPSFNLISLSPIPLAFRLLFVSGGNIPRVETKKRECWKFLDWRLNPENDSRVHGQPSNAANHGST